MKIKKSVVVTLNEDEKRALGRLTAHMKVGAIGGEDSPIYCGDFSCDDCPFNREEKVLGYNCLINQIVYLKLQLRSILAQIKDGYYIEV